jgi:polyisoprenoid-binding protein YceI
MKKAIFSALLLAWTITQAAAVPETYEINPKNSSVLFKVRLLWTTNIEGCFCGGVSGRVSFDPDALQKSTVKLEIKTDTLNTGVTQLNNEIKAPGFLDVRVGPKGQRPTVRLDWRLNVPWGHENTDAPVQPSWPQ